ncbi:S53 family peptidase [Pengzhenrongella sp.]|jgi:subtilase family serine protease|uniref:S53 family peptidase n=1 Tax=Pengzhenrongella sp. TaxID=2888820 RepID=UPI002F94EABA
MSSAALRGRLRGTAAITAALLGGALVLAAGSTAQGLPVHPGPVVAPSRACSTPAKGTFACLATFRSQAAARRAGSPVNTAGRAVRSAGVSPHAVAAPTTGYGPADIKSIYGLNTALGAGRTVAIVDAYDNPNAEKDLATFRSAYKLPACTTANGCFRKVNQRGGGTPPEPDAGWGVEIALDVQAVSAACPLCKIMLVEADSADSVDIGLAVNRAVTLGAKIVSNSYGGPEYNGVLADGKSYYSHTGVAMVVSSGDNGFGGASFPASWSKAIAVGGTTVTKTSTTWQHTAWQGAGSGCSAWVAKPTWQKDPNCLMRTTTDVSALADPDTGFAVYDTYGLEQFGITPGWLVVGGTSLAAPLISGMIALAGNAASLGSASYLYAHRSGLRDVVGGNNVTWQDCGGDYLCNALPGYDGPTGLGTPKGVSAL